MKTFDSVAHVQASFHLRMEEEKSKVILWIIFISPSCLRCEMGGWGVAGLRCPDPTTLATGRPPAMTWGGGVLVLVPPFILN